MAPDASKRQTVANVFGATFARFIRAQQARRQARLSPAKKTPLLHRFAQRKPTPVPDLVAVAVFAIDQVGPAAVRACASGVEVSIAACDEATAAVIRAALEETARRRPTDRLIRVVAN